MTPLEELREKVAAEIVGLQPDTTGCPFVPSVHARFKMLWPVIQMDALRKADRLISRLEARHDPD